MQLQEITRLIGDFRVAFRLCFKVSPCEAFHMEISFIHMKMNQHLHVNKTNFHMKGFALGLALKQRWKATRKWSFFRFSFSFLFSFFFSFSFFVFFLAHCTPRSQGAWSVPLPRVRAGNSRRLGLEPRRHNFRSRSAVHLWRRRSHLL